jgi:hypothetical protein
LSPETPVGGGHRRSRSRLCRRPLAPNACGCLSRFSFYRCHPNVALALFRELRVRPVLGSPHGRGPPSRARRRVRPARKKAGGRTPWPPVPSRPAIKAHGPRVGNGLFRLGKRSRECGMRRRTLDATIGTSLSRERVPSPLREKRPGFLVLPSPDTPGVPGSAPTRARGRPHRRPGSFALAISAANSSILSPAE